jgi:hypothetical protein
VSLFYIVEREVVTTRYVVEADTEKQALTEFPHKLLASDRKTQLKRATLLELPDDADAA